MFNGTFAVRNESTETVVIIKINTPNVQIRILNIGNNDTDSDSFLFIEDMTVFALYNCSSFHLS